MQLPNSRSSQESAGTPTTIYYSKPIDAAQRYQLWLSNVTFAISLMLGIALCQALLLIRDILRTSTSARYVIGFAVYDCVQFVLIAIWLLLVAGTLRKAGASTWRGKGCVPLGPGAADTVHMDPRIVVPPRYPVSWRYDAFTALIIIIAALRFSFSMLMTCTAQTSLSDLYRGCRVLAIGGYPFSALASMIIVGSAYSAKLALRQRTLVFTLIFVYAAAYAIMLSLQYGVTSFSTPKPEDTFSVVLLGVVAFVLSLAIGTDRLSRWNEEQLLRMKGQDDFRARSTAQSDLAASRAASAARQQFLRYTFHEVRVPFSTIVLGLEELRAYSLRHATDIDATLLQDIQLMQSASDAMQRILDDTLTFEKMESGAFRLEPRPTQLAKVLQTVVAGMQITSRTNNVQMSLQVWDEAKEWVQADPMRISQVVSNFLSNALKFVPKDGTGLVDVQAFTFDVNDFDEIREATRALMGRSASSDVSPLRLDSARGGRSPRSASILAQQSMHASQSSRSAPQPPLSVPGLDGESGVPPRIQWIRIQVRDNGVGISADNQQLLFRPFHQVDAGRLQKGKGSGLGLAICKEIVRLHGGRVGVASAPGMGSVFYADIPFHICNAPVNPQHSPTSTNGSTEDTPMSRALTRLRGMTDLAILIVDDVPSNRKLLSRALRRHLPNCTITEADDGFQARTIVQADASKYRIICMDKEMPGMDGGETSESLRTMGYNGVIIGVTANALEADIQEFLSSGVQAVVTKPVDVPHLLTIFDRFITHT